MIYERPAPKKTEDDANVSPFAVIEEFQKNVQSVIEGKGTPEERAAKAYLAAWGIDYNDLTPEEFVVLTGILKKSEFKENSISRRGKNDPHRRKNAKNKKRAHGSARKLSHAPSFA